VLLAGVFDRIVTLLFMIGVIGLIVTAIAVVTRALRFALKRPGAAKSGPRGLPSSSARGRVCPEARCGEANPADARYCARCGRSFERDRDLDAYG
jgi:hypothetical protein